MSSFLPTEPIEATRINPRIMILYGPPKVGKTTKAAELPNNLILDAERGTELIRALKVPINSINGPTSKKPDGTIISTSVNAVYDEILSQGMAEFERTKIPPKPPYKYITVDTIDKLEEFCEVTATEKYKLSTIGKSFEGTSVLQLPQGGGYYHLRNEVIYQIERLAMICEHLILISHLREKNINKGGIDVSVQDISLTGKLGAMVCAKADLIGYMYWQKIQNVDTMMISFETVEGRIMGTRVPRLANKRMPFIWNDIFLPDVEKVAQ